MFSILRSVARASSYRFFLLRCLLCCVTFSQKLYYNYQMSGHVPYFLQESLRDFQESFRSLSVVFQDSFRSLSGVSLETILSGISQESHKNLLGVLHEFLGVFWQSLRRLSGVSQKFFSQIKSLSQFFEGNAQALKTESLFSLVILPKDIYSGVPNKRRATFINFYPFFFPLCTYLGPYAY